MKQEKYSNINTEAFDFKYIYRSLKKYLIYILAVTCVTGTLSYIFLDQYMQNTYKASVNLYVIPRDNSANKFYTTGMDTAVSRCNSALNSDMMKELIKKEDDADKMQGNLSASIVTGTNVIVMSATSSSAESACRLLKAGIDNYPKLSGYFQMGYILKKIGSFSGNGIKIHRERALMTALKMAAVMFAAACGIIIAMAIFTDKIHNADQAEELLDMDVFGSIPFIRKNQNQKSILLTDVRTDPQYSESIDKIVTKLRRKMYAKGYKVLMVTSLKENDGKSTVAVNMVLNLAQRGKKVVLVDCDMRRSAVHKLLEIDMDMDKQLYDYLKGTRSLDEVLQKAGQDDRQFMCVLQKKAISNPENLYESERFEQMLQELSEKFDYVILDTAPTGIVRDAEIIAGYAQAAFMVIKQDEVHATAINDAVDILEDAGASVIGGVLNMARGERLAGSGYRKYGRYYYSYAYGKDGQNAGKR